MPGFKVKHIMFSRKKMIVAGVLLLCLGIAYWFCLPDPLFERPSSYTLLDRKGRLLGARIAEDGQWRFPYDTIVPAKFVQCITTFEDKKFFDHPGVDVLALLRAVRQNFSSFRKVSGASTISMQVIRLSRNRERNIFQKFLETAMATRLELKYSKKEILALYCTNAPFGGNVVGLNTASWRYYNKPSHLLSWGEAAALAVLPNAPSLVHPGKNRNVLLKKRNTLLQSLLEKNILDSTEYSLALLEKLPEKPLPLPDYCPQLMTRVMNNVMEAGAHQSRKIKTTVDERTQIRINDIVNRHHRTLAGNGVYNAAVLVLNVKSGEVLAYTGNVKTPVDMNHQHEVDNIFSLRSTGSVLKPLLFSCMIDEGSLLPEMLIPDVPVFINRYSPKNYNATYDGAVSAEKALSRSLNIPAVHMLKNYTPEKFLLKMKKMGFTGFKRSADNYGLSLILGGGESNLWELCSVYASLARVLNRHNESGTYHISDVRMATFIREKAGKKLDTTLNNLKGNVSPAVLSASAIYQTLEAMVKVSRPDEEKFWTNFSSSGKIAWKTGTSFGNRDAWAIGVTRDFVVGVWTGNSSGEGRPGLTGISSAAPILFDVFNILPLPSDWFTMPEKEMIKAMVCKTSGYFASDICPEKKEIWVKDLTYKNMMCPYHHLIHLDKKEKFRVHSDCEHVSEMKHKSWFVLPPSMEKYYKLNHPDYAELPVYRNDCISFVSPVTSDISLIYPQNPTSIYLPVDLQGNKSAVVFEAAHRNLSAILYWHIDNEYKGTTIGQHQQSFIIDAGQHKLILVDDAGNTLEQKFEVVGK